MRRIILLALALTLVSPHSLHADPVHLADGDSFRIGEQRYRLNGIDAPELHQDCKDAAGKDWPCGLRARSELRRIIGTHPVECRTVTIDRFNRIIATCAAGGRDLGEEMIRSGYAVTSSRPGSGNPYDQIQAQARAEKRGMWVGTFEMPREWRRANPRDDDQIPVMTPREWLDRKVADLRRALADWFPSIFGR